MKQEMIFTGKTVSSALEEAAEQLSIGADKLTYEGLEQEEAGFVGRGAGPAREELLAGELHDAGAVPAG